MQAWGERSTGVVVEDDACWGGSAATLREVAGVEVVSVGLYAHCRLEAVVVGQMMVVLSHR